MKAIRLIVALQFLHFLNAAATSHGTVYDDSNPIVRAVVGVRLAAVDLLCAPYGRIITPDVLKSNAKRYSDTVLQKSTLLPEDMQGRIAVFFEGVVRRVEQQCQGSTFWAEAERLNALVEQFKQPLSNNLTYLCFPDPISSSAVVAGQEQTACDGVKDFLNAFAQNKMANNNLFGTKIDDNQFLVFLTGGNAIIRNGKIVVANPALQALYSAYADGNANFAQILALERAAAPFLISDRESFSIVHYERMTFVPGKMYPEVTEHTETFDKNSMLASISAPSLNVSSLDRIFAQWQEVLNGISDPDKRIAKAKESIALVTEDLKSMGISL